jgi:hypothetical protein
MYSWRQEAKTGFYVCLTGRSCWINNCKTYQLRQKYAISSSYLSHFVSLFLPLAFFLIYVTVHSQNLVSLASLFSFTQKKYNRVTSTLKILSADILNLRESYS